MNDPAVEPVSPDAPALTGAVMMTQHWRDLTFLHWAVDPEAVAHRMPPGVRPDTLDGVTYEIDLNDENATKLRETLAPWIAESRRSGGRRQTRRRASGGGSSSPKSDDLAQMREWGRDNGFKVSSRGRVSQELQDAYAAAH